MTPQICTYCGKMLPPKTNEREHVVARQMFPQPCPTDMVVVPSCHACNADPKKDEDDLRAFLSLTRAATSPSGSRVSAVAQRGLLRDRGLRHAIARGVDRNVELRSESGLYLGRAMTQRIAWPRIKRVLEKWTRGLYAFEYGERLANVTLEVAMQPRNQVVTNIRATRESLRSWPGTFEYWHSRDDSDATQSRWSFLVWDVMAFIAVTNQPLEVLELQATDVA